MLNLNLGCGFKKLDGFLNVDRHPAGAPDAVVDLESLPWPWEDDSVDPVVRCHVPGHLGETNALYFGTIRELYRVCRAGVRITVTVCHPRHDDFLIDPTHVRPLMAESFALLSKSHCGNWAADGFAGRERQGSGLPARLPAIRHFQRFRTIVGRKSLG